MALIATQFMYGGARLDNLLLMETGLIISLFLYFLYGGVPGYASVPTTGPYAVGFRETTITKELYNDCSVFYPVDKEVANKFEREGNGFAYLLRYPDSIAGMIRSLRWQDGLPKGVQQTRTKFMTFISVPVAYDAPLASDFAQGKKKLQPVLWSHAEAADRMMYSGMLRELASYGFLVIALNHNDQTCMHTLGNLKEEQEGELQPKIMGNSEGPLPVPKKEKEE